jgi:NADH-quinone oxidoreductase subunit G
LSDVLGHRLAYNDLEQVRARMRDINSVFGGIGAVERAAWIAFGEEGDIDPTPFTLPIENYYMTDPISRSSATMAACAQAFLGGDERRTGTHD